jgi:uncharacterized coiled-coil protein SlyX
MRQGIRILGTILLAAAVSSPAWAKKGGGGQESQAGGLPGLEDRVEADEVTIAMLVTEVATLNTEVAALQTAVTTLQNDVAELETDVTDLEGQNNFATATETATTCTLVNSNSSAGPVTATFVAAGECEITFSKDVSGCSAVATEVGAAGYGPTVVSATKTIAGDSWEVFTFLAAVQTAENFNLTVTCSK